MREAYGGAWLIGLVALFIVLFSGFLAYSISYTKAFNVKNKIINLIEVNEGYSKSSNDLDNISSDKLNSDTSVEGQAYNYVKQALYNYSDAEKINCPKINGKKGYKADPGGYCVYKICKNGSSSTRYKVTTYVLISFPVVNLAINVPISGETKSLYYDIGHMDCTITE